MLHYKLWRAEVAEGQLSHWALFFFFYPRQTMKKTIFLVGFMGSGKSHVGKKLALHLGCPFSDLDHAIEMAAGATISTIFEQHGEAYFRLLERRALHDSSYAPAGVLATGGGTPCFFNNMDWMNKNGICIFLDADPAVLTERLWKGKFKRPLLKKLDQPELACYVHDKIAERRPFYEKAAVQYFIHHHEQETAGELYQQMSTIIGH
ncbi:MAG: shikimate kinase [Bacteroidetes bacterium]|nr:MAG: shikimate kinase [Bacteroidota bacterium]